MNDFNFKEEQEPIVLQEISTTNFDLLRLLNGGTMDSKGGLFTIRVIQQYKTKTKTNRDLIGLVFQIISKGVDNPIKRQDVIVKKVKGDTIIKEKIVNKIVKVPFKKEKKEQKTFTTDNIVEDKPLFNLEDI